MMLCVSDRHCPFLNNCALDLRHEICGMMRQGACAGRCFIAQASIGWIFWQSGHLACMGWATSPVCLQGRAAGSTMGAYACLVCHGSNAACQSFAHEAHLQGLMICDCVARAMLLIVACCHAAYARCHSGTLQRFREFASMCISDACMQKGVFQPSMLYPSVPVWPFNIIQAFVLHALQAMSATHADCFCSLASCPSLSFPC